MRKIPHNKILLAALFIGTLVFQFLMPLYSAFALEAAGQVAATALCGTPSPPKGLEVPVADSFVRQASKINCDANTKQTFKEYIIDTLAYIAVHTILRAMTNQILGWIQGTDADFIQNLEDEFIRTADAEGGALLNEISTINLCGNIGAFLKLSIGAPSSRSFRQRMTCTVTQAVNNIEGFYRNFTQGGWDAFLKISLQPQNNAYGAFMLAATEQAQRVDNKQISLQQRLLEGSGFMGFSTPRKTNCQRVSQEDAATLQEQLRVQQQVWGKENKPEQSIEADESDPENPTFSFCDMTYDTKTPGSLFSAALPEAVFSDKRRAEIADEINESISQIVVALLNKVIEASTGSGKGVLGSREIRQMPIPTPADEGFAPNYLTYKADDLLLRLQEVERIILSRIFELDEQVERINRDIAVLQAACDDTDPLTLCDPDKIAYMKTLKANAIQERDGKIALLRRADADLNQTLDLRRQIISTTDPDLLGVLDIRLGNVLVDAENIITEVAGQPAGLAGPDPTNNIVQIVSKTQTRLADMRRWLELEILEETDPDKKAEMERAREELRLLSLALDELRTAFLRAVAERAGVPEALGRIAAKIADADARTIAIYEQFKAL